MNFPCWQNLHRFSSWKKEGKLKEVFCTAGKDVMGRRNTDNVDPVLLTRAEQQQM